MWSELFRNFLGRATRRDKTPFNLVTLLLAYTMLAERVRWNDRRIERWTFLTGSSSMEWSDLTQVGADRWGYIWVASEEGPSIRFSELYNGVEQLVIRALEHLPDDEACKAKTANADR